MSIDAQAGSFWKKATASTAGNCVEVSKQDLSRVLVRDSKDPQGPRLTFTSAEWRAFLAGVRAGEFDLDVDLG